MEGWASPRASPPTREIQEISTSSLSKREKMLGAPFLAFCARSGAFPLRDPPT